MSLFIPSTAITETFGNTMLQLGMVSPEEAAKLNEEDGFVQAGQGKNLSEGKGDKNDCKGKNGCPSKMKDMMKGYMKGMDADKKSAFVSHMKSYMKDNPGCSADQMKSHADSYMKSHQKDTTVEENAELDGDSFFEDEDEEQTTAVADVDSFFEDEDEDTTETDAVTEDEDELSEEEIQLEQEEEERFETAYKVIEAFEGLDEDEVEDLTLEHITSIMSAQADLLDIYEEIAEVFLDDDGEIVDEAFGQRVRQRVTGAGRRKAKFLRRGGAKAKAKRARAKSNRRTSHMSPLQKVKYLSKKSGKSVSDIMTGRAKSRSRASGKAEKVTRAGRMQDYDTQSESNENTGENLFSTLGRLRALMNQPVESVNQEDLSGQIHVAYDVVENMANVVAERMKAEIDENELDESDPRSQAFKLFSTIASQAKKHHDEMEEGEYPVERAVTNLETLVGDLMRGKEKCKAIG